MPEQARAIFSFLLGICRKARLSSKACEELGTQIDTHRQLVPWTYCTYAQHGYNRRSPVTTTRIKVAMAKRSASSTELHEREELRTPVE